MRLRELNKSKQSLAEAGYIGGHNRDDPDYSGIDNVPERVRVRKGSRVMAIPLSALEQFKADGWTEVDQGVNEDDEYDDESGMAKSGLQTMSRAVSGLMDTIQEGDNLPEWAQQKLSLAEDYLTTVWDYLLSQKEQGGEPKVAEGSQRGGQVYGKPQWQLPVKPEVQPYTPGKPLPQSLQQKLAGKPNTGRAVEAKADPTGSWVVYNGSKLTKFKTHSGAKAYAEKNGGTVASSEYYHDKIQKQGVAEGSQRVDSLVTDALRIMRGSTMNDAVQALKTVLGDREYNGRRGHYNFYVRQIMDMHSQQGNLKEFAPGSGGGESGRWYTDDQMTDIVGDGWWNDLDVSGDIPKQQMIQQAQAWLNDQGYGVQVLNCKVNDDDMEWYIEGSFQNSRFAKKGMAEEKQRLDAKCWDGYKKQGTKMKGDTRVNNCVPESIDADQKKARQVPATEMPKKTSPVLGKASKQHPFKGRAVGGSL
jgi:hypothetical protein